MSHADETLAELEDTFELLGDWEERYRHVIDLGRDLEPLAEADRTPANKVSGCASQVWLAIHPRDERLYWTGDSDAHIVRGLIAIMLSLYNGMTPAEAVAFDARAAVDRLGLSSALSSQRSNGLKAMIDRLRADAAARA